MRRLIILFALFLSSYNLYAGTISAGGILTISNSNSGIDLHNIAINPQYPILTSPAGSLTFDSSHNNLIAPTNHLITVQPSELLFDVDVIGVSTFIVPSTGLITFSSLNIQNGAIVNFDRETNDYEGDISLVSTGDIDIGGQINWLGGLKLESSSGNINIFSTAILNGGDSLHINASNILIENNAELNLVSGGASNSDNLNIVGNGDIVVYPFDGNIQLAPVPVPLPIVLFSSALFSLLPIQHRKRITP